MPRILYECSDLPFPAGGVQRLYRHVEILHRHGFSAHILHHAPGFVMKWFPSSAPVEYWTDTFRFYDDDVLVIPEGHVKVMQRATRLPCRRVAIALNWGNIFRNLAIGNTWHSYGIESAIAGSSYERAFILATMAIDSTTIASGIDTSLFVPATHKRCQITYMPRKHSDYFHLIAAIFRARHPTLSWVPFIAIDMVPQIEVATLLSTSSVFLAHTFPEGLSRKTLEAMACGNVVVGFAGGGSLECMDHMTNCYLVNDGDFLAAADFLEVAVREYCSGVAAQMQLAAIRKAQLYSLAREEEAVLAYWFSALNTSH